ncbi:immunoglobulin superfamily member 1-like [Notamacropus eugenii]|uniref:immunoglobulin superfamily member 1-like n=1 Tax=Notamacropus eugenii TaxID=9315 RepID=UPI003B67FD48
MGPAVTFLLSVGLCLDWTVRAQTDPFPRPTLWAIPSPVVPKGADVTLTCQGHLWSERFQLWKDGKLQDERNAFWQQAEFVLRNVDAWEDARSYSCRSGQGPLWSEFSEALPLVVTEIFPRPSISASSGSTVSPGTTVTIWCDVSPRPNPQDYSFALLEARSLEPLQRVSYLGTNVTFTLLSVRPKDSGNYICIYYRKTVPHTGSNPSQILELTVPGLLPRPTLWAQTGFMMAPQANITLWCSRPKLPSIEKVTFTLWEAATQISLQQKTSADHWTTFLLPSVAPEDTKNYSCTYKEWTASARASEHSYTLELVVPGSLPKPSLSALPGLVVEPGMHVTLQCRQPPQTLFSGMTFTLLKVGSPQPLQRQSPAGTLAIFPLLSVSAQDAGNYLCIYQKTTAPCQVSEPSEVLQIWVTERQGWKEEKTFLFLAAQENMCDLVSTPISGSSFFPLSNCGNYPKILWSLPMFPDVLSRPSLSAWPSPKVASGSDVTLFCWGPSRGARFLLYKEEDEKNLLSMNITQHGALYFLNHVTPKYSGNYSCTYQLSINGSLWTQHSDSLQLIVTGSEFSNTLLIVLSCVSCFLLLLCFLLLAILCQGSIPVGSLEVESPRRCFCFLCLPWSTCLPHHPEASRGGVLYTGMATVRPKEPSVPLAEDPQGVTYAQLNARNLNKRKANPKETTPEPTLYTTLPLK